MSVLLPLPPLCIFFLLGVPASISLRDILIFGHWDWTGLCQECWGVFRRVEVSVWMGLDKAWLSCSMLMVYPGT